MVNFRTLQLQINQLVATMKKIRANIRVFGVKLNYKTVVNTYIPQVSSQWLSVATTSRSHNHRVHGPRLYTPYRWKWHRRQELQHMVSKSILNSCQTTQGKMSEEITHQYQVNIKIHQLMFLCSSLVDRYSFPLATLRSNAKRRQNWAHIE